MDRLQKKCFVASVGLHALLAAVLLFGPAFLAPRQQVLDLAVLDVIPPTLVDAAFSGGGTPEAKPPPPAPLVQPAPPPTPAPAPQPAPQPRPQPPVARSTPAPASPEPAPVVPDKPVRHRPKISTELVTRTPDTRDQNRTAATEAREQEQADAEARRRLQQVFAGALNQISDIAASSTEVSIPGPGGQAYANYAQVVKSVYTHAWIVPADVNDDQATTTASVTIGRDGRVLDARITRPSGNTAVDASVRRTLERVTIVAPFPAGATEEKRTFTIKFNLKAKRQLG